MPPVPVVVDVWTVPAPERPSGVRTALTDPAVLDPTVLDPTVLDAAVLDPAERARAAALPPDAAARFVLGRVLLRHAVATRLGCAPGAVALRAVCPRCGGPHGRVLAVPGAGMGALHVSVTRSGPVVAVAVCAGAAVGIDVESTSTVAAAPLADVALSPRERDRLGWRRTLARTWVRKEAALKALGTGLELDPTAVEVRRAPRRAQGVDAVVAVPEGAVQGAQVAVADLRLGRGRVGAVAVLAPGTGPGGTRTGGAAARLVVRRYDGVSTRSGRSS